MENSHTRYSKYVDHLVNTVYLVFTTRLQKNTELIRLMAGGKGDFVGNPKDLIRRKMKGSDNFKNLNSTSVRRKPGAKRTCIANGQ
jgi:hypothetical protein